ncbi:MAG: hypothetical protein K0Q77_1611 [Anaerosporomusa subterranea]|jgi:hypothetical protein|nr:hypothetical protein [Anaerosporomusa subterranea]
MITGISKIMPVQRVLSVSNRNSQLAQDRRKKKEQATSGAQFAQIEKAKQNTNTRNA